MKEPGSLVSSTDTLKQLQPASQFGSAILMLQGIWLGELLTTGTLVNGSLQSPSLNSSTPSQ